MNRIADNKLYIFFISLYFNGLKITVYKPNVIPKRNCFGVGHAPESTPILIPRPPFKLPISGSSPVYLVMVKRFEPWK
jgi:hypothetical protein